MPRFFHICLIAIGFSAVLPGTAGAKSAKKQKADTVMVADTVVVTDSLSACPFAATLTEKFIRMGEMVAERDIALFTADLLNTYKALKNDERNLTRLFMQCDRSWGETAYALALQAASRRPLRAVLTEFDTAGRDWEQAALRMKMIYRAGMAPDYTFGLYLERQQAVWRKVLDGPERWRRTFLDAR